MTAPDSAPPGFSPPDKPRLSKPQRRIILSILAVSIVFEIISRLLQVFGTDGWEVVERSVSAFSTLVVTAALITLVRMARQGQLVRVLIWMAMIMLFTAQVLGITNDFDTLDGTFIVGAGTMSNRLFVTLADYSGLVCLVLGFFVMIFDLDDAYQILGRQQNLLETQLKKQADQESALRASEERYRKLVEATRVIPWELDPATWRFTYVGPQAVAVFGYELTEWYGKNFWPEHIHPDDREEAVDFCVSQTEQRRDHDFEYRMLRADGQPVWIRDLVSVVVERGEVTALRGIMVDISEQRAAAEALEVSERRFRFLYNHTPVMMHSIDEDGRIIDVNQYWLDSMGYQRTEVLGQRANDFLTDESRREADAVHMPKQRQLGHLENVEFQFVRKNGEVFDALLSAVEVRDPVGHTTRSLAFIVDVSEQKRIEQEQSELLEHVQHSQKLESLGVLAGGIAHDFNNLLMGIVGNTNLALGSQDTPHTVRMYLEEIDRTARKAADLCEQMLSYSGRGAFVVGPVDLNRLVREMGDLLQTTHPRKIDLQFELEESLPRVEGDAGQLNQVVMNLILNASEAIGDDVGSVTVRTRAVVRIERELAAYGSATLLEAGDYVELSVRDSGPGMSEEVRARIFEPFFSTKFTGRGLGMAVVQGIVRGHGGGILVDSGAESGTTVSILFPVSTEKRAEALRTPIPLTQRPKRNDGMSVLVADDEPAVLAVTRRILERAGYEVLPAQNGKEAVDIYTEHHHRIAVAILDLTMPVLSGNEAAAAMQRINPEANIVLASGFSAQDVRSRAGQDGIAGFLQKPYRPQQLLDLLDQILAAS